MINTRLSSLARPLEAVFNTYQDAPVKVLLSINVAPSVKKRRDHLVRVFHDAGVCGTRLT